MPARSKSQFRKIQAIRSKYHSRKNAPKNSKWAFDYEWTDVDYKNLPNKISDSYIMTFEEFKTSI